MRNELLVFQHIPKTAGTTWRAIAYRQYPDNAVCPIYDEDGYFYSRAEFAALPESRKRKFVLGHFGQGIRRLLPPGMQPRFGVFLRDPVERCASFIEHLANHHRKLGAVSVSALIAEGDVDLDNQQVRMLSETRARFGAVTPAMLAEAATRLEHYAFVGLCHRFTESYALATAALGWKVVPYADRNLARARAAGIRVRINAAELRQLARLNRYDAMLLERAERLFEARVADCKNAQASRWQRTLESVRRNRVAGGKIHCSSDGGIGLLTPQRVRGWARLRRRDEPAQIVVSFKGGKLNTAAAAPRPALQQKGVEPAGRCGFELRFPGDLTAAELASVRVFVAQSQQELRMLKKA